MPVDLALIRRSSYLAEYGGTISSNFNFITFKLVLNFVGVNYGENLSVTLNLFLYTDISQR